MTDIAHFPRPGQNYPYAFERLEVWLGFRNNSEYHHHASLSLAAHCVAMDDMENPQSAAAIRMRK